MGRFSSLASMDISHEDTLSSPHADRLSSVDNPNRVNPMSSPTGRVITNLNGTGLLLNQVLRNSATANSTPTEKDNRDAVSTEPAIAPSITSAVEVLGNLATTSAPLVALDVVHTSTASVITQNPGSSVDIPGSPSTTTQSAPAIALTASANSINSSMDIHALPAAVITKSLGSTAVLSSPESEVISKLASRIKLIDGSMDGVPKLASSKEGGSGSGGSKLKQGLEPCSNPSIPQ